MRERTRNDIPIELPPAFHEEALRLRNKLLMYRFKNRNKIKTLSESDHNLGIDFSALPDRMQQAARPVSVVVGDHPELQVMLEKFLEEKAKTLVIEASETIEGQIIKVLADEEPELNSDTLTWELTIGNIFERIKSETGDPEIRSGQVRSRANSLGLKTKRDYVGDKRQRVITCDKPLFDRLKRRYIPEESPEEPPKKPPEDFGIGYFGPDSPYWGLDIIWDNLDDLDNDGGEPGNTRAKNTQNTDGRFNQPRFELRDPSSESSGESRKTRATFAGTPRDRPDWPGRTKTGRFSQEDLDEVLTCRRIKAAIAGSITDPIKLAEAVGIPVCIAAKWPGVNSIAAEAVLGQLAAHRRELHFNELADRPEQPQTNPYTIACSVCGADLTGHGRVENNGKIYCPKPGCGYPPRTAAMIKK